MPSFRQRVLDALDIKKTTLKLQVNETFPKIYSDSHTDTDQSYQGNPNACSEEPGTSAENLLVPYAVSKSLISTTIGPSPLGGGAITQTLDVLGFVVGKDVQEPSYTAAGTYKNMYPVTTPRELAQRGLEDNAASSTPDANSRLGHAGGQDSVYTGFFALNGLYDSHSKELQSIRKSALPVDDLDTMTNYDSTNLPEHSHKDWPDNPVDQHHLLNENPYADALYYHSMRLSFLLTGITIPNSSEKASNHRGLVRMLILRPRLPTCKMRWDGVANQPHINMAYPPHWDTDLFYSKTRTLGGRMNTGVRRNYTDTDPNPVDTFSPDETHLTPTFGLLHHARSKPEVDVDLTSLHYGHIKPQDPGTGEDHTFTSYDMLTAPINREKYAVVVDKMVTLDTVHHGVASKRIENVVIPFNKKVKFPGRMVGSSASATTNADAVSSTSNTELTNLTIDEPLNMQSRPIIMFLSMDQKISAQVTGYTTITEC